MPSSNPFPTLPYVIPRYTMMITHSFWALKNSKARTSFITMWLSNEVSQCKMEAWELSHFALPNSSPSFSDFLIMSKIIGLLPLCSLGRGNQCRHLLITQTTFCRSQIRAPQFLRTLHDHSPVQGGSHGPPTTHAAAWFVLHGTHTEMVPRIKVSNHMCNRIILHSLN